MESGTRNSGLKQRLARIFRSPSLLRSACKPSTSGGAGAGTATNLSSVASTRALLEDAVLEPVFVPRSRSFSVLGGDDVRQGDMAVVGCGGCRPSHPPATGGRKCRESKGLRKKERRVRETGGYYETGEWEGRTCPPASPSSPSKSSRYYRCFAKEEVVAEGVKKRPQKQRLRTNSYGFSSSSSAESDDGEGAGFFSSEEKELEKGDETETFFSSRSFSSDSSEFYQRPARRTPAPTPTSKKTPTTFPNRAQRPQRRRGRKSGGWGGGCKGLQSPLISAAVNREKTKRGFAVVKRSSDPYNDFRASMVEMIIERQIFAPKDLEGLLESYLSLNAHHLHPVIMQAFSDIWVVLFASSAIN